MSDAPFPILGSNDPVMHGHQRLLDRVWEKLTKQTPDNLQIVGPRYVGKSVLLRALVEKGREDSDSPYKIVAYWDLSTAAIGSDGDFIKTFCRVLKGAMTSGNKGLVEPRQLLELAVQEENGSPYDYLQEALDDLEAAGCFVLMVWDGFEKPLDAGVITGHLLGNLRELVYGKKHKLVTASRRTLQELTRSQELFGSGFFNIFPSPERVGPFEKEDCVNIFAHASCNPQSGGVTELFNWTAGYPILFLAVINKLVERGLASADPEEVNEAATAVLGELDEIVDLVWSSFPVDAQDFYRLLVDEGEVPHGEYRTNQGYKFLNNACLVTKSSNGIIRPVPFRMLKEHVHNTAAAVGQVKQLFGNWEKYESNIREVLSLRLSQIRVVNAGLYRLVKRCIEDIPSHPGHCLNNLTAIEDDALELIWKHECGDEKAIPSEVIQYWEHSGVQNDYVVEKLERNNWKVPVDRLDQVRTLERLTGSRMHFSSRTRSISKDTYVLINALHTFRNRSEHKEGQEISLGVGVSAIMTCIELLACLEKDLG